MAGVHMVDRVISVIRQEPKDRRDTEIEIVLPWLRKKSPLFEDVEKGVLMEIVRRCEHQFCVRDDVIITQGEIGDRFYITLTGSTAVYIDTTKSDDDPPPAKVEESKSLLEQMDDLLGKNKEKKKKKLDRSKFGRFIINFPAGKSFGEVALMTEDSVRNATIIADENTDLLVISKELFDSTLKAKKEEEYREIREFIDNSVLFKSWSPKFKRLLEMSLRKEKYAYDSVITNQGETMFGIIFIIRGQVTLITKPGLHEASYYKLFRKKNHLIEAGIIPDTDKDEPKVIENVTQDQIRVRRKEGYAAAERRINTKTVDLCFLGQGEMIGDIELVMNMSTFFGTAKCNSDVHAFILDLKNYDRLVGKKNPFTHEVLKKIVEHKVKCRLSSSQGSQLPLLKFIEAKIEEDKPKITLVGDESEEEKKRKLFMKQLVGLFIEGKVPLIEPSVPDSVYYRHKSKVKLKERERDQAVKRANKQSSRFNDADTRLSRARMPRRRVRSRRELEQMKIEPPSIVSQVREANERMRALGSGTTPAATAISNIGNQQKTVAWGEGTKSDNGPKSGKGFFLTTPNNDDNDSVASGSMENAWREIDNYQRRRSSLKMVCSSPDRSKENTSSVALLKATQLNGNASSEGEDDYFDYETSGHILSSLEERLKNFYNKQEEHKRNVARVTELRRFEIKEAKTIPIPGGTVYVRTKPCKYPRGVHVDPQHHQHVRRHIIAKRPVTAGAPPMLPLPPGTAAPPSRTATALGVSHDNRPASSLGGRDHSLAPPSGGYKPRPHTALARVH